jgi:hypothetical protein
MFKENAFAAVKSVAMAQSATQNNPRASVPPKKIIAMGK